MGGHFSKEGDLKAARVESKLMSVEFKQRAFIWTGGSTFYSRI